MLRLSVQQIDERDELVARLEKAKQDLEAVIFAYNRYLVVKLPYVEEALARVNGLISESTEFCDGLYTSMSDYFDEPTKKWQESDAAESYLNWMNEFDRSFEEIGIELPKPIASGIAQGVKGICETLRGLAASPDDL